VQLTEAGATGVILDGLPEQFPCLQWHSAEITKMPLGGQCLATSPDCAVQAMSWGPRAYSLQFHVEIETDTVANWLDIPEYATALDLALGKGAGAKLAAGCAAKMSTFNQLAERIYINWMQTSAQT
jgi:GMP synthase-like glutamine amidotransferase